MDLSFQSYMGLKLSHYCAPSSSNTRFEKIKQLGIRGSISIITLNSPLKQFKLGIKAQDVKCDQDLQLVIKSKDDHPACVKISTITRLISQGWILSYISNQEISVAVKSNIEVVHYELAVMLISVTLSPGIDFY